MEILINSKRNEQKSKIFKKQGKKRRFEEIRGSVGTLPIMGYDHL